MASPTSETSNPVYFWRPEGEYGFLGQWWPSSFSWKNGDEEFTYANAEQHMMHRKALLFAGPSHPITHQLQKAWKLEPGTIRDLGRQIPDFSEQMWQQNRYAIVLEGNYLKFSQNGDLRRELLATEDRELVEASPRDRIWGVGFGAAYASENRREWGLNLLGKALMETRERLRR
ncbi:conserved hypothetical protein [Talaromyces stipitatus ATCC 10500]|uniref:NADAR domain-containing protein n=1 Tax=Talaromyces stipitatus (strain ATCC 10500 / CBS 375.48 / QM 6759 / NRRL 1006) TaxID=441959 RepID=B8ME26_TALSN|nr:uncharacterized protein TSTA_012120 [Talaromyces stipitatus ATCC 10500]EED16103.1 conserved hypothetical protein [Talaromyces stipitatus ATCC 10500]